MSSSESADEFPDDGELWRTKLHHVLTQEMSPDAFERLVKRMLRESGFVQVEVTGRSGDGGIDGDQLADKLKELNLGIKTEMVESVDLDVDWFRNI